MTATPTLTDQVAVDLAEPDDVQRRHRPPGWWAQSLANGALGVALMHVERARTDRGPWARAHNWLRHIAAGALDSGRGSNLHYGAPALAYVLHHASTDQPGHYARALATLDTHIAATTTTRRDAAHRRIDAGQTPALAEFDAIRGLTGLGAYWLRRDPHGPQIRGVLDYLVRLTEPLPGHDYGGLARPGWWTHLAPNGHRSAQFPDGHANNGVSHGIAGPLALLALAAQAGTHVPDHRTGIQRILTWLDHCRRGDVDHPWWPYWSTHPAGSAGQTTPGRPSWCYGTTGLARAQQLAGLALGDPDRTHDAERAIHTAITAPDLINRLDDAGLCHGTTGALHLASRAARDSQHELLARQLPDLHTRMENDPRLAASVIGDRTGPLGVLDGAAGIALALDDHPNTGPGWDTCLLTS